MVMCKFCKREMTKSHSCDRNPVIIDGKEYEPVKFGDEEGYWGEFCHDCAVVMGGYHHYGCDAEECPKCGGQLLGCGCLDEEQ